MSSIENADLKRLLADIIFWGERLTLHLGSIGESEFHGDATTCDAVCWCIACIGEAAGAISRRWPDYDAELQLSSAYAMRNRIAHGYFKIDFGIVWAAATVSVALVTAARAKIDAL